MIGALRYKGEDPMAQFDPPDREPPRPFWRRKIVSIRRHDIARTSSCSLTSSVRSPGSAPTRSSRSARNAYDQARLRRRDPVVRRTSLVCLTPRFFIPVSLATVAFGDRRRDRGLVSFGDSWITAGLTMFVISFLIGMAYLGPQSERSTKLGESDGPDSTRVPEIVDQASARQPHRAGAALGDRLRDGHQARLIRQQIRQDSWQCPHSHAALALLFALAVAAATALPAATTSAPLASLRGKTIVVDPGHNGGNAAHPEMINKLVPGRRLSQGVRHHRHGDERRAAHRARVQLGRRQATDASCSRARRQGRADAQERQRRRAVHRQARRDRQHAPRPTPRSRSTPTAAEPAAAAST